MVDITEISAMVAAAGVLIGVVYYILDVRNQRAIRQTEIETRQADLLMGLYTEWDNKHRKSLYKIQDLEFESYDEFVRKYGEWRGTDPLPLAIAEIGGFFEVMGLLVHRKLADIGLVTDMFPVVRAWEKLKPIYLEQRKKLDSPRLCEWFEYLYNETKKREQAGVKSG